jgi:hypothetical protein
MDELIRRAMQERREGGRMAARSLEAILVQVVEQQAERD